MSAYDARVLRGRSNAVAVATRRFVEQQCADEASDRAVVAFMDLPRAHRKQIASTNPLERLNAEIKRRTDVVGIFPNAGQSEIDGILIIIEIERRSS